MGGEGCQGEKATGTLQFEDTVRAVSGRRSEGARSGVLPYLWLSHDDTWRKGGKRSRLGEGNEREETGTQVDPQTGELARGYTVLI